MCEPRTQICPRLKENETIDYRIDQKYPYNLANWYSQMNMMCMSESKINLLVSIYFIMLAVGGLLFFPVPDMIGRKKTHYIFSTINLAA